METGESCQSSETTFAHAVGTLERREGEAAEAHIASCGSCRRELESLHHLAESFVFWPIDILRPAPLGGRLARRLLHEEADEPALPALAQWHEPEWHEPEWHEAAPGIEVKLFAADHARRRVSMLVRLAPNASYPAHRHAGAEELHLLEGELWIDGRKLHPGDYHYGAQGTSDHRVWSETGCTGVLITSSEDILG